LGGGWGGGGGGGGGGGASAHRKKAVREVLILRRKGGSDGQKRLRSRPAVLSVKRGENDMAVVGGLRGRKLEKKTKTGGEGGS